MVRTLDSTYLIKLGDSNKAPYLEDTSGDILSTFNAAVLGQLLSADEAYNLRPGLLDKFEFNYKTKAYTLRLKKDVTFHNGRKATSKDLEFSLLRGFFSENSSFYSVYLSNIAGIEKIDAQKTKYKTGLVSGVQIIDDRTIEVRLSNPNPSFLHALTNPFFSLVPAEAMNSDLLSWQSTPIGAGPYAVVGDGFKKGHVKLKLVDKNIPTAPKSVVLYTTDNPNIKFDIVDFRSKLPGLIAAPAQKPAGVKTLFFSNQNELGKNKYFRAAIQKIIDRSALAEKLQNSVPTHELLPSHFWGRTKKTTTPNEAEALRLIKKVPLKLLEKNWEVAYFAGKNLSPSQKITAEVLEGQFQKLGLKIKFIANSEKFLSKASATKFPMSISTRVSDYVDPLIMFASLKSGSAYKYDQPIGTIGDKFDTLYEIAASADDFEKRIESIKELSKYVQENAIATALSEEYLKAQYNPDRIESLGDQPQPLTIFIQNIKILA